jgi:hypothetical protein
MLEVKCLHPLRLKSSLKPFHRGPVQPQFLLVHFQGVMRVTEKQAIFN